jgi:hypothetical protein
LLNFEGVAGVVFNNPLNTFHHGQPYSFCFAAAISFALKPSSSVALSNKTAPFYERLVIITK